MWSEVIANRRTSIRKLWNVKGIGSTFFDRGRSRYLIRCSGSFFGHIFSRLSFEQPPIVWDEDGNQIHLAVLVHVGKNNAQAFQIWDHFAKIFADKQLIKQLLKKPDYENFIECIKKSLESNIRAE